MGVTTYVLYHANCADGFGAAWAAWRKLGDDAEYVPVKYGDKPPQMEPGSWVYIVDFSYPREVLDVIVNRREQEQLVVIDHHKTAEEALRGFPGAVFDADHSGAVLTWRWFHPGQPVPRLLEYVEDRDLWRWRLDASREVSAWMASHPRDFHVWDGLAFALDAHPDRARDEGAAILRAQAQQVERVCANARLVNMDGHYVPCVNAACYQSEVGEKLLEEWPDADFSASWMIDERGRKVWSLRSRGFDVSEIAKAHGGGGHRDAAGFVTRRIESPDGPVDLTDLADRLTVESRRIFALDNGDIRVRLANTAVYAGFVAGVRALSDGLVDGKTLTRDQASTLIAAAVDNETAAGFVP